MRAHHYLDHSIHKSAACYAALVNDQLAAFTAVLAFPHAFKPGWREHRTVCLPDFQGVGIGNAMSEYIAAMYSATGKPYYSTTSNPAMIHHRKRSTLWEQRRKLSIAKTHAGGGTGMKSAGAIDRMTAGFVYVGEPNPKGANRFGVA